MSKLKQHWENIYKEKGHQQVSWYQDSADISLHLLDKIKAKPTDFLVDVGSGASVFVDALIERGFNKITLVDLSREALDITKNRLGDNAAIPEYKVDDVTQLTFNEPFDIWHDRAVFHFLTNSEDRKKYMDLLCNNLSQQGRAIIGTFSLKGPNMCSGLDIVQYDESKLKAILPEGLVLESASNDTHTTPSGAQQEFIYFIIKRV